VSESGYSDQAAIKRIVATTAVPANMPTRIAISESQLNSFVIVHPLWMGRSAAAVMPAPITTQPITRLTPSPTALTQ
jgi:hypothetical protein